MPLQNFVDFLPPTVKAAFLNAVDILKFTVFDDATTKAAARTAIQLDPQLVPRGTDAGAVNAAVVTLTGPITGYVRATGSKVSFVATTTNTGASTLNVNATGAAAIVNQLGNALTGGELSRPVVVEWTGAAWKIIAGSIPVNNARTALEIANAITPTNYDYEGTSVDLRRYGGLPDGATDATAAFVSASVISAAGGGNIVAEGGTYRISSSVTIARNATLEMRSSKITIDTTKVLTITGSFIAPRAQVFTGAGTVTMTFGGQSTYHVLPEWWGASGDGVTNSTAAINAAIAACGGGRIEFAAGVYLTDGIIASAACAMYGPGKDEAIIKARISTATITGATSTNPIQFTTAESLASLNILNNDIVLFAGLPGDFGTNLNGVEHIVTVTGANTFTIAVNGVAYAAYTAGGTAKRIVRALILLNNAVGIADASAFTVRSLMLDANTAANIGIQVNNYSRFCIEDITIQSFITRGVYFHGAILASMSRVKVLNCPLGFEADSDQSHTNAVTLRDCSISGSITYGIKVTSGSVFIVDACDIEACGTAGSATTGGIWFNAMDPDSLGVGGIIKGCWIELCNGYAGIRIDSPAVSYTHHVVSETQVFAGTRTYGLSLPAGANFISFQITGCSFKNAATADLNFGTNVIGSVERSTATVIANTSTNILYLPKPTTGNIELSGVRFELPTDGLAFQTGALFQGSGVPNNANGSNGDYYFRTDTPAVANQRLYVKSAGAWVGIL